MLGICNGFQALVKAGLFTSGAEGADRAGCAPAPTDPGPPRAVTLTHNANGRFECRWVHLVPVEGATAGVAGELPAVIACPVAHGEGRIAVAGSGALEQLEAGGQVLFRYVDAAGRPAGGRYPANPNGSAGDVAGLCNPAGNVWGLMPHPEDHVVAAQDPFGVGGPQRAAAVPIAGGSCSSALTCRSAPGCGARCATPTGSTTTASCW